MSRVAAIVLNWNGGERNLECLRSLARCGEAIDVLFVDNGSTDGSPDAVAKAFPRVEPIRNGANLGFCEGNNVGMRRALERGAEFLMLLNNDVRVERGFLAPLVRLFHDDARVGAAGPRVLWAGRRGRVWAEGGTIRFGPNLTRLRLHGEEDDGEPGPPSEVDYLPGCALLLRAAAVREVGLLDPEYFAYAEDVEYGVRLRRAGWKVVAVPASRVFHAPSASTGGGYSAARKYASALNQVRFLRRHGDARSWASFVLFDLLGLPVALALQCRRGGRPRAAIAKARGLLDGLRGRRVSAETFERAASARQPPPVPSIGAS